MIALKPPKNNLFADTENRYGVMWNKCGKFINGKSRIIERGTDQEIRRRFFFFFFGYGAAMVFFVIFLFYYIYFNDFVRLMLTY